MKTPHFKKDLDSALLTYCVLRRLGAGNIETFEGRLKCQKVHYFAQLFGVSPGYVYGLYLRGPYSPGLANDLFALKEVNISYKSFQFVADELEERLQKLKAYLHGKSIRQLELASTLHWLLKLGTFKKEDAKKRLQKLKNASDEEVKLTFKCVLPLL